MIKDIATTKDIFKGKTEYLLSPEMYENIISLEVFNSKKNKWENREFEIYLKPIKKLKTDTELKITYKHK